MRMEVMKMAMLTVRNLPAEVHRALRVRAAGAENTEHGGGLKAFRPAKVLDA